jgi:hypothetical protein
VVLPQPREPLLSRGTGTIGLSPLDIHQCGTYARRHRVGIAAHIDHRTIFDEIPDMIPLALDHVLDEGSWLSRLPREGDLAFGQDRQARGDDHRDAGSVVSLKIGPCSRARDIRLSIGWARSIARTSPTIGKPLGPGSGRESLRR